MSDTSTENTPQNTGLRRTFVVEYEDGTKIGPFTSTIADVVRWEIKNDASWLTSDPTVQQYLWLAFVAGRRNKLVTESAFEAWFGKVADYSIEEVPDADPSSAAAGDGS